METKRYKSFAYEITTDPEFMDKQNAMTPELRKLQESLYFEIMEENKGEKTIGKLLKLIEKYPDNPQLKNYLCVAYKNAGNYDKALEVNHWILKEHPGYLFGKLNLAAEYYEKGEFEKMPEVLGTDMEIQGLYPHRKKFHMAEVTGFYKIAILYFISTGNLEAARGRLEIMQEVAPDHPDTEFAAVQLIQATMKEGFAQWEEEEKTKIHVTPLPNTLPEQIITPPVFENEIINLLYEDGLYIDPELINDILKLPRESLIDDLEKILDDLQCRYEFFRKEVENEGWEEEYMSFPLHAMMLLGELRAEESLPKVLNVLSQDEEFLRFWFDDHLTGTLWEPLYHLGNQQLDVFKQFMQKPGVSTFALTAVSAAVFQIPYHQPERNEEVMMWYAEVLEFFANSQVEDNVIDSDTIGLLICDVVNMRYKTLLPQLKRLYDKGYVTLSIPGDYREIEKDIVTPKKHYYKKDLLSIQDRYEHITNTWAGYNDDEIADDEFDDDDFEYSDYEDMPLTEPIHTGPKIGRNDPCPCGSGKKYKKCCMNKNL